MDYEDYMLTVDGFRQKMQVIEGWHRRSAYIIAQVQCAKDISRTFDNYWPYGDEKLRVNMAEVIKEQREKSREAWLKISSNVQFNDALKKLKRNGGRSVNTSRG